MTDPIDFTLDEKVRIRHAVQWIRAQPRGEAEASPAGTARMFRIEKPRRLYAALRRPPPGDKPHGGQNRIPDPHQTEAIVKFARHLVCDGIDPDPKLVWEEIMNLRRKGCPGIKDPSYEWFRKWYKEHKVLFGT